jgi:hypothetical protein
MTKSEWINCQDVLFLFFLLFSTSLYSFPPPEYKHTSFQLISFFLLFSLSPWWCGVFFFCRTVLVLEEWVFNFLFSPFGVLNPFIWPLYRTTNEPPSLLSPFQKTPWLFFFFPSSYLRKYFFLRYLHTGVSKLWLQHSLFMVWGCVVFENSLQEKLSCTHPHTFFFFFY